MELHRKLLLQNKAWVQGINELNPNFLKGSIKSRPPDILWIGCSDLRVSVNEITGSIPGEMLIHRNIANLVIEDDLNVLSAIQYAVEILEVSNIIVCGHYGCRGVKEAMATANKPLPLHFLNSWLDNIKKIHRDNADILEPITDNAEQIERLVELNVEKQIQNLAGTSIITKRWLKKKTPVLRGWVYVLDTGFIKEIIILSPHDKNDLR